MKTIFWLKYTGIMLLFGIMSILSIAFFPVAYFSRYVLKWDLFSFLLNDTEDGDFGADWWLKEKGLAPGFWTAWRWTCRNSAWKFKLLLSPKWDNDTYEIVELHTTVKNRSYSIDWPNKDSGKYGKLKAYYLVDGALYGRYGFAREKGLIKELQLGAAGNRYKFRLKI